jgi:hypothetical protein
LGYQSHKLLKLVADDFLDNSSRKRMPQPLFVFKQ